MAQDQQRQNQQKENQGKHKNPRETNFKEILDNEDLREGEFTKKVEHETAKIPSSVYLLLAVGSMVASGTLALIKEQKAWANFVGLWVPSLLLLGIYNKLVKIEGSDRFSREAH